MRNEIQPRARSSCRSETANPTGWQRFHPESGPQRANQPIVSHHVIGGFEEGKLPYVSDQARTLEWLAEAHTAAQATLENLSTEERRTLGRNMRRRVARFGCDPSRIA